MNKRKVPNPTFKRDAAKARRPLTLRYATSSLKGIFCHGRQLDQISNRNISVSLVSTMISRLFSVALVCFALQLSGCAVHKGAVQTQESQTLRGVPVKITSISVPSGINQNVQYSAGSVWATHASMSGFHKTIRIDPKSHQVTKLSRPWTAGFADLLVDERSIWFSDGMTKFTGRGDLYRLDIETNQVTATIEAAGTPFDFGDGAIWAYNPETRIVSGIDTKNNQVRTQLASVTQGFSYHDSFAFGAGSIWQLTYKDDVSAMQLAGGAIPPSVVRRIDPYTNKVIAELPIGPYRPSDRIRFVGGAIWVLGERDKGGKPFATRIDVKTNLVVATIPLVRSVERVCAAHSAPKTPVIWNGDIWVATFCSTVSRVPYILVKIDLQTNQVTDELRLPIAGGIPGNPLLATGDGALWALIEDSVIRVDL